METVARHHTPLFITTMTKSCKCGPKTQPPFQNRVLFALLYIHCLANSHIMSTTKHIPSKIRQTITKVVSEHTIQNVKQQHVGVHETETDHTTHTKRHTHKNYTKLASSEKLRHKNPTKPTPRNTTPCNPTGLKEKVRIPQQKQTSKE